MDEPPVPLDATAPDVSPLVVTVTFDAALEAATLVAVDWIVRNDGQTLQAASVEAAGSNVVLQSFSQISSTLDPPNVQYAGSDLLGANGLPVAPFVIPLVVS